MPRESFHRELDRLVEKVVELGREVESCLDAMIEALEKHDAEASSNQLGVDAHYKERGTQIAETRNAERDPDLAATLREMAHGTRDLFRRGLDVFETRDIEHSEELEAADDWVDLMYSEAMNLVVNPGDK